MNKPFTRFLLRWFVSALGIWIAAGLLGDKLTYNNDLRVVAFAGLVLAIVNSFIKPIVVILSLPAILFSLGLFMIVINGLMVLLAAKLYGPLQVDGFGIAVVAGIIIGLVNYLVSTILEETR